MTNGRGGWITGAPYWPTPLPGDGWLAAPAAAESGDVIGQLFPTLPVPAVSLTATTSTEEPIMDIIYSWKEGIDSTDKDGNTTHFTDIHSVTWDEAELAKKRALDLPVPVYITWPGNFAQDSTGALLSLDANGAVYRDGRQMKGVAASKIVVAGKAIYALGKTVPSWWAWGGQQWVGPITDGDPNILK